MKKISKQKINIESKKVVIPEDLPAPPEPEVIKQAQEELDPEVMDALNIKRRGPKKSNKDVDYIPELERDIMDGLPE